MKVKFLTFFKIINHQKLNSNLNTIIQVFKTMILSQKNKSIKILYSLVHAIIKTKESVC